MVSDILYKLKDDFVTFFPNMVAAFIILVIGLFVANLLRKFIFLFLSKIGIDKFAEKINEVDFIASSKFRLKFSTLICKTVYYFVVIITLIVAADKLQVKAISDLLSDLINYIPVLISAIILLLIGVFLADLLKKTVYTNAKSFGIPSAGFIANFVFYLVMVMFVLSAMTQAKIDTTFFSNSIILFLGGTVLAFSIGYGLASKDTLGNYLASFYLKDKLEIGDDVTIDGIRGIVIVLDKSSLTLRTQSSDSIVYIPLSKLIDAKFEIHSRKKTFDKYID